MDNDLKDFFSSLAPFNEKELVDASVYFHPLYLKKKEYFCRQGSMSRQIAFVKQGILRSYFTIGEKENTSFFQLPGTIVVALRSFVMKKESQENIQALTDAELISISREDLYALYTGNWKWQQVGRVLIESYYIFQEKRMLMQQNLSAQERYLDFSASHPEVLQSVPLQYVASYLGVSPETLSRIRATL
jgi:CRP-like cAMP-binding protein